MNFYYYDQRLHIYPDMDLYPIPFLLSCSPSMAATRGATVYSPMDTL